MSYGMDADGDGMLDFAELQAYEKFKAEKDAEARAAWEAQEAAKAGAKAAMVSDYDTVPGFAQRRGWHGQELNTHNYGVPITKDSAIFPCNKLPPGKMAQMLKRPVSPTAGVPMEPTGRARERGGGGIDEPIEYYEADRLALANIPGYTPSGMYTSDIVNR
jgi:hypothetical protein